MQKINKPRGRRLGALEAAKLSLAFEDSIPLIEKAISGETTARLSAERLWPNLAMISRIAAPFNARIELGKEIVEQSAAENPLVEPAKKCDKRMVESILEQEEYRA